MRRFTLDFDAMRTSEHVSQRTSLRRSGYATLRFNGSLLRAMPSRRGKDTLVSKWVGGCVAFGRSSLCPIEADMIPNTVLRWDHPIEGWTIARRTAARPSPCRHRQVDDTVATSHLDQPDRLARRACGTSNSSWSNEGRDSPASASCLAPPG